VGYFFAALFANCSYRVGMTIRVSRVEEIRPPTTTTASGRWISEPVPLLKIRGMRPAAVVIVVIRTGRNFELQPAIIRSLKL